jgi:hypothetical protein
MSLLVRAFPILPGQHETLAEIARDLQGPRAQEAGDFFARHGVARETWHVQETPHGLTVIVVTEIADRPVEVAGEQYAASRAPFDVWFKEQVERVTGYDPDTTPLGPPTTCVFDSAPPRG